MAISLLDDILAALGDRVVERKPNGHIICWCPFHPDGQGNAPHVPNLSIKPGTKGAAFVWGCPVCDIGGTLLQLAGRLREIGIMEPREVRADAKIVKTYSYCDEGGQLLFEVVRKTPKGFRQRRPDGDGGWAEGEGCMDGIRRVPYHLPELLAADPGDWVHVVEGEKDANNLALLHLVATTNPGGAGKWRREYSPYFKGRRVAILPDNDAPGQAHAEDVAGKIAPYAAEVKLLELPDLEVGEDVSDWLKKGHGSEELAELLEAAPIWEGHVPPETAGPEPVERFRPTDSGNAELFAHLHGDRLRYDHRRKRWLLWIEHWWQPDAEAEIYRLAKLTARQRYQDAPNIDNLKERDGEARWAIGSESRMRLESALFLAQAEHPIADAGNAWDNDPYLMGVANGVLDLHTGTLRDGEPGDRLTMHSPVPYIPDAPYPYWIAFLDRVMDGNEALIDFLQRAAGYSLTGDVSEQVLFFLYGTGANGKSTFLTAVLDLLGDYGRQAAPGLLLAKRGERHPTEYADLENARFVSSVEVDEGRRLAESLVKWLTGGDRMKARKMRQDFYEFNPTYKIWLAANFRPTIKGTDLAIWRRIRLVPFTVAIPEPEQDKDLLGKLRGELPGILNWALEGCLAWQRDGLIPPSEVKNATDAYRAEQDVLATFLDECCKQGPSERVAPDALYIAYTNWAKEAGEKPLPRNSFGARLTERGYSTSKDHDGRWRDGLGLKNGGVM